MGLRGKLVMAFTVLVSLPLAVGVTSLQISRGMRSAVAELRPSWGEDLRHMDPRHSHLEIEGYPAGGTFVATDVAISPGPRRPKLRGTIEAVAPGQRTFQIFGLTIHVGEGTEFPDTQTPGTTGDPLEALRPGDRVEISASLVDGRVHARKIRTARVKRSDQIKGSPDRVDVDGSPPETVAFGDLVVSLSPGKAGSPQGALRDVELATQMTLEIQEARAAAHMLVGRTALFEDREDHGADQAGKSAAERLVASEAAFEHYLDLARTSGGTAAAGTARASDRLAALGARLPRYRDHIAELLALADDPAPARLKLDRELEPFLQNDLLPIVYGYRGETEEALAERIGDIARGSATTTRVAGVTSALAVVMATVMCIALWRAIGVPVRALHEAALDFGRGRFDVRVEPHAGDELGDLANAFNDMVERLAATTVSVQNLESIFDSMSAVLVLLDGSSRITNVNAAAGQLLGYEPDALVGVPFSRVCADTAEDGRPIEGTSLPGVVTSGERRFLKRDGTAVSVSFSAAELRSQGGPAHGYVCVAQDLSDRKQIEKRLRASVAEKDLLLREVHHRVKNNMQVISSLLAVQASYVRDPAAAREFEESQNRIRSMALIHEQLYRATHLSDIDLRIYLEQLTSHLVDSFGSLGVVEVSLDVEDIELGVDQALACGLLVNELVTNSLKHACRGGGSIRISLHADGLGACTLRVADDGPGLNASSGPGGLGLSLVTTLVKQLQGQLRFGSDAGAEIEVAFPNHALELAS